MTRGHGAARPSTRTRSRRSTASRLGFMSFFVKAGDRGAQGVPGGQRRIDGDDIVYKNYYDIGVAVGTEQGLMVPVLRDADQLGFAEIEKAIADFGRKAPRRQAHARRPAGRHLHHHQRRRLRLAAVDADPQPAAERHPRHAHDPEAAGGGRRQGRDPADDVPGALLRPPHRRRPRGGDGSWCASRNASRTPSGCCSDVSLTAARAWRA